MYHLRFRSASSARPHFPYEFLSIQILQISYLWRASKVEREPAQTAPRKSTRKSTRERTILTRRSSREANFTGRQTFPQNSGIACPRFRSRVAHCESSNGGRTLGLPQDPRHLQYTPYILPGSQDSAGQIFAIFEGYAYDNTG